MTARAILAGLALALAAGTSAADEGVPRWRPTLAATGSGLLAQRTIEREWGLSDDSVYVEVHVPGLKSEALAASLSAILPGAGQLYVGENSGWLFAALEAAGWGGWWWQRREADRLNRDAATVAGTPDDPASGWSFQRWSDATEGDPAALAELYAADREAFYNAIATDPAYGAGWSSAEEQLAFSTLRSRADTRRESARLYATALWIHHLVAAVDALRAARFHNLPLRENLRVRVGSRGTYARPGVTMAVEVRF
jgi:hypothetical protein